MNIVPRLTIYRRVLALGYDYSAQATHRPTECNLCGTRGAAVEVTRRDRYGYPATFVVCSCCGLGYLCPRLSATQYTHFYADVYRPLVSAYHGRRIDAETVQLEQRGYAAELAAFLLPLLPSSPHTILDVGGSTGVVSRVLTAGLNARVTVLDPSPDELAVAHATGMETVAGLVEDFDPDGRKWDLVLLCQTIDHLLDIRSTLTALRQMTAAGGHAFIDIVDLDVLLRRTGNIERVVKIDHPYYLTRTTAVALFTLTGFALVAERLSDDGHRGFVLAPGPCAEPDWASLKISATHFLARVS